MPRVRRIQAANIYTVYIYIYDTLHILITASAINSTEAKFTPVTNTYLLYQPRFKLSNFPEQKTPRTEVRNI
jgi:hypothetical protein